MKFTKADIEKLTSTLDKMERLFAYKYEVPKKDIAFVIKGKNINVLVDGKLKESLLPSSLPIYEINEETGLVNKKY